MKPTQVFKPLLQTPPPRTHNGAVANRTTARQQLERTVMSALLFEDSFYEDGMTIANRIAMLVPQVDPGDCVNIAIRARHEQHLRHVPLLIAREMARHADHNKLLSALLPVIINRPDELSEFLALYWVPTKQPLTNQVKVGLARAFCKFNEHQFSKYVGKCDVIKLRDVMFLVHPKPTTPSQAGLFNKIADNKLAPADTWEVALSGGANKCATFTRLITEDKLGELATLKNLRNMVEAGVSPVVIRKALSREFTQALPFRFIAAARYCPAFEPEIERAMLRNIGLLSKLPGKTIILVDVSGSMNKKLSEKSDMTRMDAACGLAVIAREMCEDVEIHAFSSTVKLIPARRGFALRDAIIESMPHQQTYLGDALNSVAKPCDRLIVITDEQTNDVIPSTPWAQSSYVINVSTDQNGVSYKSGFIHIDGFSENVFKYVAANEDLGPEDLPVAPEAPKSPSTQEDRLAEKDLAQYCGEFGDDGRKAEKKFDRSGMYVSLGSAPINCQPMKDPAGTVFNVCAGKSPTKPEPPKTKKRQYDLDYHLANHGSRRGK